jgi:hypothetical protein
LPYPPPKLSTPRQTEFGTPITVGTIRYIHNGQPSIPPFPPPCPFQSKFFGWGANAGVVAPQVLHYRAHPLPPMQGRGMFPGALGQEGEMEGEEGVGGEEDGVRVGS